MGNENGKAAFEKGRFAKVRMVRICEFIGVLGRLCAGQGRGDCRSTARVSRQLLGAHVDVSLCFFDGIRRDLMGR